MIVDLCNQPGESATVRLVLSAAEARELAESLDHVLLNHPLLALRRSLRGALAGAELASPS